MKLSKKDFTTEDRKLAGQKLAELVNDKGYISSSLVADIAKKYNVDPTQGNGIYQALSTLLRRWGNGTEDNFATRDFEKSWWSFMVLGYLLDRPVPVEESMQDEQEIQPVEVLVPTYGDPFAKMDAANQMIIDILNELHIDLLRSFKDTVVPARCTNAQFEDALQLSGMHEDFLARVFN